LNYGIYGAIFFRFIFVYLGAIVLQQFNFLILGFAAILLYASYQGLFGEEEEEDDDEDLENDFIVQNLKKVLDVSPEYDGNNFITEANGKSLVTPLLICLLTIEISDIVFATDSVPAVLGTTKDQFIAYSSNVFAVYGLRTLFFLLDDAIASFAYLEKAVNFVLGFIGLKIFAEFFGIVQIDVLVSLVIVLGTLLGGVGLSLLELQADKEQKPAGAV
jgi:TerC family integral membrane protein